MKIGSYGIFAEKAGHFRLDGGAMFGVVPKVFWETMHPADDKNRILLSTSLVLLADGKKNILIDTGNCDAASDKMKSIYSMDSSEYSMQNFLSRSGISREDITDVILTHLHFDHAGGAVSDDGTGALMPAFPNAVYHVQKKQFAWAMDPSGRDRASYMTEQILPIREAGRLSLVDGPGELFPGIELIVVNGHTPGMQLPLISGGGETLLYGGDLIPLRSHIAPPWIMAYDLKPLKTLEEKERILGQAADENWMIFFEHDPAVSCCRIERQKNGFRMKEEVALNR
ncbi:MAG: MBL fold metallo-hydrolase [Spirochaetales bacterium]|nr:MAG: MBL fold metallo-hydrolase [Spirochaetales bacterium]